MDAFWKARCYEKRLPPWFMSALLAAGIREKCLTPYHYYSVYSWPLRELWDSDYSHSSQEIADLLVQRCPAHVSYLFELLSEKSNQICDIRGFVKMYRLLDPACRVTASYPHPWRKDEECTALELLEELWKRRKSVKIPLSHEMSSSFEMAIVHLKNLV